MSRRAFFSGPAVMVALLASAFIAQAAAAADKVTALDLEIVPPTVISGGVDWKIYGDDNRNASAKLEYREVGAARWKNGLDLFRLQHEDMNAFGGGSATAPIRGAAAKAR